MEEDPRRARREVRRPELTGEALASQLVDASLAGLCLPKACPCDFGSEGRYRLEEVIGIGTDSFVYRAVDRRLSDDGHPTRVAIKIHNSGTTTLKEAIAGRRVQHEHVVQVLDSGETDQNESYLVSELVQGGDLSEVEVPMEPRRACRLIADAGDGVQALHNAGLVHGDLKPQNILLTDRGTPKIADFNLAANIDNPRMGGNPAFRAPETLTDDRCTPPSDIYALGGILYYLLTGRLPNGDSRDEIERRLAAGARPEPPGISRDLDRICLRALEPDPSARYPSAAQFADDLRRWLDYQPIPWIPTPLARRTSLWVRRRPVHATVVFAALALGIFGIAGSLIQHERLARVRAIEAARAQRRAAELNEQTKASLRHIFRMASTQSAMATRQPRNTIIPAMVWLEYLSSLDVLGKEGTHQIGPDLRIQRLREFLQKLSAEGRAHHTDACLAAFVLAYTYIQQASFEQARQVLETYLAPWRETLDPHDPVAIAIATMDRVTATMLDPSITPDRRRAILNAELEDARRIEDCREAVEILQASIDSLRASPPDARSEPSS